MPKKHHSEEQIISALKQYEGGEKTADICRKLGVSQATFYMWKKQYAGLGVQELRELRSLREENGRLKRIVADLTLDRQILQEVVSKSSKASPEASAGEVGAGDVSDLGEAFGFGDGVGGEYPAVHQLQALAGGVANATTGSGGHACALWVQAPDRIAAPGRLEGERQARLPALRSGEPEGAQCGEEEDQPSTTLFAWSSDRPKRMLVCRFRQRQADGWALLSHPDGDRSVYPRVCCHGSRSLTPGKACGCRTHPSHRRTWPSTAQHHSR